MARYDQCDDTCTTDCGHCKGAGRPAPSDPRLIATVDRLSALPIDTLLRDVNGHTVITVKGVFVRHPLDLLWPHTGQRQAAEFSAKYLPMTVLYAPEEA